MRKCKKEAIFEKDLRNFKVKPQSNTAMTRDYFPAVFTV